MSVLPCKDGIDYFPFDTDFFADDKIKLIRSEFGTAGIIVLIYLYCEIYRGSGYYKKWNEDICILSADGIGCGCEPKQVQAIVEGCLRRELFNRAIYSKFHVLTSPGIQKRYLRASSARDEIRINTDYWLLDVSSKKQVPPGILKKIVFFGKDMEKIPAVLEKTGDKKEKNPQSKGKESRVKKSRENTDDAVAPTLSEVVGYVERECPGIDPERFFDYYSSVGWRNASGQPLRDWKPVARNWARSQQGEKTSTYDIRELESFNVFNAALAADLLGKDDGNGQKDGGKLS